jgi:predicted MFS family arabinose efflux permease
MQQQGLGYIYGFVGTGLKAGNPAFEISAAFPELIGSYGLLSGPAFSISYAIAGIFMGLAVEKMSRKNLLIGAVLIFSASTMVSSITTSFYVLFLMRFILGMFVSATEPAGFSILGDYFPKSIRTTANAIMGTGAYIGSGVASLLIIVVNTYGWRAAYAIKGGLGLIVGILGLILLREPEKGIFKKIEDEKSEVVAEPEVKDERSIPQKFVGSLTDAMSHPVSKWTSLGAMFRYFGIFACDYYVPMFFLRNYVNNRAEFAMFYSLIVLFGGFTSSLVGGLICDKFGKGRPMIKSYVCVIGNLLAMPMFALGVLCTGNFYLSISMMALKYLFGEPWKSPAITMIQNTAEPSKFGNIVSAYQFFYIMAGCLSTVIFGILVNVLGADKNPVIIGKLLAAFCTIAYSGASAAFYIAGRHYVAQTTKTDFTLFPSKNTGPGFA